MALLLESGVTDSRLDRPGFVREPLVVSQPRPVDWSQCSSAPRVREALLNRPGFRA